MTRIQNGGYLILAHWVLNSPTAQPKCYSIESLLGSHKSSCWSLKVHKSMNFIHNLVTV